MDIADMHYQLPACVESFLSVEDDQTRCRRAAEQLSERELLPRCQSEYTEGSIQRKLLYFA